MPCYVLERIAYLSENYFFILAEVLKWHSLLREFLSLGDSSFLRSYRLLFFPLYRKRDLKTMYTISMLFLISIKSSESGIGIFLFSISFLRGVLIPLSVVYGWILSLLVTGLLSNHILWRERIKIHKISAV